MSLARSPRVAALGVLLFGLPAQAEEPAASEDPVFTLPSLIVEARHWREDAQAVPGSVEVLTRDRLETPLWDSVGALPKLSPNVQIEDSSVQTRIVVRGMTSANTALQDPVGFFVNDVALPLGASQAPALFDVERMEILKGPQGSLFGRNTEAGAVRIITAEAASTAEAWASLTPSLLNAGDRWQPVYTGAAGMSGPIGKTMTGSLAVRAQGTEGVHHNRFDDGDEGGDLDRFTFSGGLGAQAGDATTLSLKSVVDRVDMGKQRMRYLTGPYATKPYVTNYNTDAWDKKTSAIQSLRVDHAFDALDLTSITGWTSFHHDFQMDLDTGPLATRPTELDHWDNALSQELRLASREDGGRWRWLGGLHTYRQWSDISYKARTPRVVRDTTITQTGLAGFGQGEVRLWDDLRLGVGTRVEWIGQKGNMALTSAGRRADFDATLDTVTVLPKLSLAYDVTPEVMVYGSLARGYLPGGYNYSMATGASSLSYDAEYSWTAETGVKARLWDDRLAAGLALFHTRTTDKQILDLEPGGAQKFSNAAEAEVSGLEGSLDARLTPRWSLFGTLGLQRAEATEYSTTVSRNGRQVAVDYSGKALPMAPDVTWSVGGRYDAGSGWFAQASLNGAGSSYFDSQNTLKQGAFVLADAEVGYRFKGAEVAVWSKNLTGETVYTRAVSAPLGAIVEDGAPREVGLRLRLTW
ncbi:TonB-dependent receptor [Rhodospirillum rubrum]|uniref:TonB-dependent receptor n=1 Tax=Rhodospirillum rubrum TaxID=1085 RepID=UPI001904A871|nr:TonB-dependent receptor [Rhodospirillum rubrum]MBK1665249.1 TonB-dependent receptor [Rhodospirillum rubrum]MBK1678160.1 TonB-dependent receptor [Rhodospirillum rubrum]